MSRKKGKPNDPGGPSPNDRRLPDYMDPTGDHGPVIVLLMVPANLDQKLPTNPFIISRSIKAQVGAISAAYRDKDGHMVLKTRSEKKAAKLLELAELIDHTKVKVMEHAKLNQTKCIVTCRAVDGLTEAELKEELKDQGVTDVARLGKGGKSATMVVTVRGTVAPKEIFFGFEVCRTREYKQGPMQCFRCFDFGHTKSRCQAEELCRNCSKAHAIAKDADGKTICEKETSCKHCKGAHVSTSRSCSKYREEEEIEEIRTKEDKSAREARRLYEERKNNGSTSYAAMAASGNSDARRNEAVAKELKQTKDILAKALKEIAELREAEAEQRERNERMRLDLERAQKQIADMKNKPSQTEEEDTTEKVVQQSVSDPEMEFTEAETLKRRRSMLSDSSSDIEANQGETLIAPKAPSGPPKTKNNPRSEHSNKPNPEKKATFIPTYRKPKTSSGQSDVVQNTKLKKKL